VLVAVAVAGLWALLVRARTRRVDAIALIVCLPLAVCATPALARTPRYYVDVMTSEAVRRGYGLWAPPHLDVLDVLLFAAAAVLGLLALRARPRPALWELVAAAALALATIRSPRNGLWLLLVLSVPAARALAPTRRRLGTAVPLTALMLAAVLVVVGVVESGRTRDAALIRRATAESQRLPVLATPLLAERVAARGGRVWISNPVEAFTRPSQAAWIDWLELRSPVPQTLAGRRVLVLVPAHGALARHAARSGLTLVASEGGTSLYAWTPHDRP
jgi:hypothetical protein